MELTYNDLKKREVINVSDGKSLGYINNLTLSFPKGVLTGITVPGSKKNCLFRLFDRNKLFIDEKRIIKIGSDVILVDIRCGDTCGDSVDINGPTIIPKPKPPQPCPQPCPPPCPPNSPKRCGDLPSCEQLFGSADSGRIDTGDY
jgi:YlmC/YmxH family sporulation protein